MKNDTYANLKRTGAEIYQKRTEELAQMKRVPEDKRDDGWKYRYGWMLDSVRNFNRCQGERATDPKTGKFDGIKGQGLLSSLHELVERRDPGYIIPSMSCLKREEAKK